MQISEIQIDANEAYESLKTLDITKACGPDGILARVLKKCALCFLFNKSLMTSSIPDEWKKSN